MKGEIVIDRDDNLGNIFTVNPTLFDFSLSVYLDEDTKLETQLKNKKEFDRSMFMMKTFFDIDDLELNNSIEYLEKNFDNIFENTEYIKLALGSIEEDEKFIEDNPIVLTKKIVLSEHFDMEDYDKIIKLMDKYSDNLDKIYVELTGNIGYVSIIDAYKTVSIIKKRAEDIKSLNLSPMETIMYVYDQVRNRVYKFEDKDDSSLKSRDLTQVILGDKIVCVGYAKMFGVLLRYLDINCYEVHLEDKEDKNMGHCRSVIYVQDPKYNIDGVYYFDPTWDSRRQTENNEYLNRYRFFAKTKNEIDSLEKYRYIDENIPVYSKNLVSKIKNIIAYGDYEKLLDYRKTVNHMNRIVNGDTVLIDALTVIKSSPKYGDFDKTNLIETFSDVYKKFNKKLSAEVLVEVLANVRKVEYYQNPEWYSYSFRDLIYTCLNSKWDFKGKYYDSSSRLRQVLFNEEIAPDVNAANYITTSGITEDIAHVKLTKVLSLTQKNMQSK